jgi:MSHA biogenesis protein MshO
VAQDTQSATLALEGNPFALQTVKMPSPGNRFQIVSGPVQYACDPGTLVLTRYAGYAINPTQVNPPTGGTVAPLTRRMKSCSGLFTYDTATGSTSSAQRTALVSLTLELAARTPAGTAATSTIRLVHQVHVDNTP